MIGTAMKLWLLGASQDDVDAAVADLQTRHGGGARHEAVRLADVAQRLGSARNKAIYLAAGSQIASLEQSGAAKPNSKAPLVKVFEFLKEFGQPLVPDYK